MSYFFSIKKLNKIIFSFLIIFSFFQVYNDSFANKIIETKKGEINKAPETITTKKDESKTNKDPKNEDTKNFSDKISDSKIDIKQKNEAEKNFLEKYLSLIISGLSLLLNLIFILFYFMVTKSSNQKIEKFKNNYKLQKDINEKKIDKFVNTTNKHISSFIENFETVQTEIKHINKAINSIQTSAIESPKNKVESLREKIRKDNNNEEEIKEPTDPKKEACNDHFQLSKREFMKKYTNAVTLDITNADDVVYRNNEPIFNESEQGKYITITLPELGNSNHYLFYAKGTNITSEDIALKTVFNFDKEIEVGKIYDSWEITQSAILINNNNNWQIIKKGKIEL